jgi:hypothetical protein
MNINIELYNNKNEKMECDNLEQFLYNCKESSFIIIEKNEEKNKILKVNSNIITEI